MKKERGITLISLVVTIIVLLILAGVTLTMLTGENGIMTRAKTAREKHEEGKEEETNKLAGMETVMNDYLGASGGGAGASARADLTPAPTGDTYNPGDEVTLGSTNQKFFVLSDDGTHVTLLAKYCLNKDGTAQTDSSATSSTYQRQFSESAYWYGKTDQPVDLQGIARTGDELDAKKNAIAAANSYGSSLAQTTGKAITGRVMTLSEAEAILQASTEGKTEAEIAQITKMKNILYGQSYESDSPTEGNLSWWLCTSERGSFVRLVGWITFPWRVRNFARKRLFRC